MSHPRDVLLDAMAVAPIPVCDHYCGVQALMAKSLALQAELAQELGACVFDVTLDCEDGAPVGGEREHACMVAELVRTTFATRHSHVSATARVAVRVHPVDHPSFEQDVETIVGSVGSDLCHLMLPKVESVGDVECALLSIDRAASVAARTSPLPIHVLVESPLAVRQVASIAAHPRVQSISFGLMDFVSAHGGAIPFSAMGVARESHAESLDQFSHPLVVRAKLEVASACHAAGKVPSHCVVTEFRDQSVLRAAANRASRAFGFTRMWSIHPAQIRPIVAAFAPAVHEVEQASAIVCAAHAAGWAPISVDGKLHDRASYRYFWQVLQRAQRTARLLPDDPAQFFFRY